MTSNIAPATIRRVTEQPQLWKIDPPEFVVRLLEVDTFPCPTPTEPVYYGDNGKPIRFWEEGEEGG